MNPILRGRIEHLIKVLSRRRFFLNARERTLLANAKKVLAANYSDAQFAEAAAELARESTL